jgi:sigma-E factor negative regulatory protein RseC
MEQSGFVKAVDGGHVLLEIEPAASGCGACHAADACASRALMEPADGRCTVRWMPNHIGAHVGDRVVLTTADGTVGSVALLVYLLPALLLLAGAALGTVWSGTDGGAVLGALAGLVLAVLVLRACQRRLTRRGELLMALELESAPREVHLPHASVAKHES